MSVYGYRAVCPTTSFSDLGGGQSFTHTGDVPFSPQPVDDIELLGRKTSFVIIYLFSRYGSQLARIEDASENNFVGKLARNHLRALGLADYWIGM